MVPIYDSALCLLTRELSPMVPIPDSQVAIDLILDEIIDTILLRLESFPGLLESEESLSLLLVACMLTFGITSGNRWEHGTGSSVRNSLRVGFLGSSAERTLRFLCCCSSFDSHNVVTCHDGQYLVPLSFNSNRLMLTRSKSTGLRVSPS